MVIILAYYVMTISSELSQVQIVVGIDEALFWFKAEILIN